MLPKISSPLGNIFIIIAPSGAGKSSLIKALLARDPSLTLSISYTTRAPRPGEVNGREYHFVTHDTFKSMLEQQTLLEWAEVHDNFYGTPCTSIDEVIKDGKDILLEIDWQGAQQIKLHYPLAISIFILPPSFEALESRLKARAQDHESVIAKRLLAAKGEIVHISECEYVIINQEFSMALDELAQIILTAKLRFSYQALRHAELFSQLDIPFST